VNQAPLRHNRAAATDDARESLLGQRDEAAQHARVDGHVVHALPRLMLHDVQKVLLANRLHAARFGQQLVHRHGSDRHGRMLDNRRA
jgi:hypothetical protein